MSDNSVSLSDLEDVKHVNAVVVLQTLVSARNHAFFDVGTQTSPVPEVQFSGSDVCFYRCLKFYIMIKNVEYKMNQRIDLSCMQD